MRDKHDLGDLNVTNKTNNLHRIIEKKLIWNILRKRVKLIGIVEEYGLGTYLGIGNIYSI